MLPLYFKRATQEPTIYTLVPTENNFMDWGIFKAHCWKKVAEMPMPNMIWYPFLLFGENIITYKILILLYHIIPGYLIDLILLVMGKKPR